MYKNEWKTLGSIRNCAGLFFVSVVINFLSSFAFKGIKTDVTDFFAATEKPFTEEVVKKASEIKKIVVLDVNGVIQDTGEAGHFCKTQDTTIKPS